MWVSCLWLLSQELSPILQANDKKIPKKCSFIFLAGNVFICHVFPSLHLQTWRVMSATCLQHVFGHVVGLATLLLARVSKRRHVADILAGTAICAQNTVILSARPWRRAPLAHIMGYGGQTPSTQYISVTLTSRATRRCAGSEVSVHHSLSNFTILGVTFCMHNITRKSIIN